MPAPDLIRLDPRDTVAVCRIPVAAGTPLELDGEELPAVDQIPQGHKIALAAHGAGDEVIKYGHPIGVATKPIGVGEHVHVHNLATVRGRRRIVGAP